MMPDRFKTHYFWKLWITLENSSTCENAYIVAWFSEASIAIENTYCMLLVPWIHQIIVSEKTISHLFRLFLLACGEITVFCGSAKRQILTEIEDLEVRPHFAVFLWRDERWDIKFRKSNEKHCYPRENPKLYRMVCIMPRSMCYVLYFGSLEHHTMDWFGFCQPQSRFLIMTRSLFRTKIQLHVLVCPAEYWQ